MSQFPSEALNDWGHKDLEGFANYIGSPVQHIREIAEKNKEAIEKANNEKVVDSEESD